MPMIGDADDGYVAGSRLAPEHALGMRRSDESDNYRSLIATGAVLFNRADLARKAGRFDDKSRWLFGRSGQRKFDALLAKAPLRYTGTRAFPHAGYYLLGDRYETRDEVRMIVDAGPLGYLSIAAHGHADALSFVLSVGRRGSARRSGHLCLSHRSAMAALLSQHARTQHRARR